MFNLVNDVHLIICLDQRVQPGPILQSLDLVRAREWTNETILICDEKWASGAGLDQSVIGINRKQLQAPEGIDGLLEQLDGFEIHKVTVIGELNWARWLMAYFEGIPELKVANIDLPVDANTSPEIFNTVASGLELDFKIPQNKKNGSALYIYPYENNEISMRFRNYIESVQPNQVPEWVQIVCEEEDSKYFYDLGFDDYLVDPSEMSVSLHSQPVFSFDPNSWMVQTSRAYSVATFSDEACGDLFVPGDMSIDPKSDLNFLELIQILTYWRLGRLRELSFQWPAAAESIQILEASNNQLVARNLAGYSTDVQNCRFLIQSFLFQQMKWTDHDYQEVLSNLHKRINNDMASVAFSLKILSLICERMLASAAVGERLFQRLGSDYYRILLGETLVEGLISLDEVPAVPVQNKLNQFLSFLVNLDARNDEVIEIYRRKESR